METFRWKGGSMNGGSHNAKLDHKAADSSRAPNESGHQFGTGFRLFQAGYNRLIIISQPTVRVGLQLAYPYFQISYLK